MTRKIEIQPIDPETGAAVGGTGFDPVRWEARQAYALTGYCVMTPGGGYIGRVIGRSTHIDALMVRAQKFLSGELSW